MSTYNEVELKILPTHKKYFIIFAKIFFFIFLLKSYTFFDFFIISKPLECLIIFDFYASCCKRHPHALSYRLSIAKNSQIIIKLIEKKL
jgi:hypothetical protein